MANSILGGWAKRTVVSTAPVRAWANGSLGGWSLTNESVTRLNWSTTDLNLLRSPAHSEDQFSLAEVMRLRACASKAGSNRPNCTNS